MAIIDFLTVRFWHKADVHYLYFILIKLFDIF
jgi:hypothetical protein